MLSNAFENKWILNDFSLFMSHRNISAALLIGETKGISTIKTDNLQLAVEQLVLQACPVYINDFSNFLKEAVELK